MQVSSNEDITWMYNNKIGLTTADPTTKTNDIVMSLLVGPDLILTEGLLS